MEIGEKVIGFKFEGGIHEGYSEGATLSYNENMDKVLGCVGLISSIHRNTVFIRFKEKSWRYPKHIAEKYLVNKTTKDIKFKLIK